MSFFVLQGIFSVQVFEAPDMTKKREVRRDLLIIGDELIESVTGLSGTIAK